MVSFSGLTSGLDTDFIIKQLVRPQMERVRQTDQRIQDTEVKIDALESFKSDVEALGDPIDALTTPSTFDGLSTSQTKEDVLTASIADVDKAKPGESYEIFVEQLAKNATRSSGKVINNQTVFDDVNNATSVSDFAVSQSGGLDPSSDWLGDLQNEVDTVGGDIASGDVDIRIQGDSGTQVDHEIRINLEQFENNFAGGGIWEDQDPNFNRLMEVINDYKGTTSGGDNIQGVEVDTGSGQTPADWNMKINYDFASDHFQIFPTNQTSDAGGGGGDSFVLSDFGGSTPATQQGFFQAVGMTVDSTNHTFNDNQTALGENVLSIDPKANFADALFNIDQAEDEAIQDGDAGVIRIANQDIFWSTDENQEFGSTSFGDERDDANPVNPDSPVTNINELVETISEDVDGVDANYNSATDRITLEQEDSGAGDIELRDLGTNVPALGLNLNLSDQSFENLSAADTVAGQNSQLRFGEGGPTQTFDSNSVEFEGLLLELKQLHQDDGTNDPVEISVGRDNQSIVDQVKAFVKNYNNLRSLYNVQTSTEPIGDDQDSEEQSGPIGPLQGESITRNTMNPIIRAVTDRYAGTTPSDSPIESLSDVGIEQVNPLEVEDDQVGTLKLDEGELKSALQNNREDVEALFRNVGDGASPDGVFTRLKEQINGFTSEVDGTITTRLDGLDRTVDRLEEDLNDDLERLEEKEKRLQREFRRMEQMLLELQNQQRRFSLGGGGLFVG